MTSILDLPEDVTRRYIFSRLAPPDLARCESTCAAWRSAVRADEASTWLASLSFAYDPPEKPPHRLDHAPAPAPIRVAYARRAQELGGWRALAAARARVERLTSELIRDPDVEDVMHLQTSASFDAAVAHGVRHADVWTTARRRFADADSRAWAISAARSSRLGSEAPPDSIDPEDTWHGYVDFTREDPTDTAARERRRWRRRRYELIASLVAVDARKGIADALGVHAPAVSSRSPAYQSYVVASVERAAAHISALVWDGWVERDFRGDGVAYIGGLDADSAHRVDPDAVIAALDKLGAEFKRRLDVAGVDPDASPLEAMEVLGENVPVLPNLVREGHAELEARLFLRRHPPYAFPHALHGVDERAVRHQGLVHQSEISGDGSRGGFRLERVPKGLSRRERRSRDAYVGQVAQEPRDDVARHVGLPLEHLAAVELEAVPRGNLRAVKRIERIHDLHRSRSVVRVSERDGAQKVAAGVEKHRAQPAAPSDAAVRDAERDGDPVVQIQNAR